MDDGWSGVVGDGWWMMGGLGSGVVVGDGWMGGLEGWVEWSDGWSGVMGGLE